MTPAPRWPRSAHRRYRDALRRSSAGGPGSCPARSRVGRCDLRWGLVEGRPLLRALLVVLSSADAKRTMKAESDEPSVAGRGITTSSHETVEPFCLTLTPPLRTTPRVFRAWASTARRSPRSPSRAILRRLCCGCPGVGSRYGPVRPRKCRISPLVSTMTPGGT